MKKILGYSVLLFVILFLSYITIQLLIKYDTVNSDQWSSIATTITTVGSEVWTFVKPFLQLTIILIILEWILQRVGIKLVPENFKLKWNIQTIIALIVVCAFCIAALGSIPSADSIKDLALVVVGFYFGSNQKSSNEKKADQDNNN